MARQVFVSLPCVCSQIALVTVTFPAGSPAARLHGHQMATAGFGDEPAHGSATANCPWRGKTGSKYFPEEIQPRI